MIATTLTVSGTDDGDFIIISQSGPVRFAGIRMAVEINSYRYTVEIAHALVIRWVEHGEIFSKVRKSRTIPRVD